MNKVKKEKEEGTDVTSEKGDGEWGWVVSYQVSLR